MTRTHSVALLAVLTLLLGCSTQLRRGLDERDANDIVSALLARGFSARKVPEASKTPSWAVEVEHEEVTAALQALTELKLPRPPKLTTKDLAEQSSLIETPHSERLRAQEALEGDLEQALELVDGVASASVELALPTPTRPGAIPAPSKAAVLLRVQPEALERLNQQRGELRALVAGAVDGLGPDDVVLVYDGLTRRVTAKATAALPVSPRLLVIGLAVALSVLAVTLVVLTIKLRRARARARAVPTTETAPLPVSRMPTPPPSGRAVKPVVSPAVQRRVA